MTNEQTDAERVEALIDLAEELGMSLLPWQAEALRAILLQPVKARFMVSPREYDRNPIAISPAILADINRFQSRSGFVRDMCDDEEIAPRPGMVRVFRDGEWTWVDMFEED